jgi:hypothetical protein
MQIDVSTMPDYDAYYKVIGLIEPEFSFKILFTEPYYFQIVNYLYKSHSAEFSINIFYYINFILTVFFFIWLAFLKDISIWKKMFLYSFYYYLFAFVLLRNTFPYVLTGFLFYYLHQDKYLKITILSFLGHLSSVPILLFSVYKNKLGDKKLFIYLMIYVVIFNFILHMPFFNLYEKFNTYQEQEEYGQNLFHKIYFVLLISGNIYLFFKNRDVIYNYTYMFIFSTYLFLQMSGPVMGFRFSVYLIIYLILNPKFIFSNRSEHLLNVGLPVVMVFILISNIFNLF